MEVTVEFAFVICIFIVGVLSHDRLVDNNEPTKITKRMSSRESNFDISIDELLSQTWTENERPCLEQILATINNVKNSTLWATWIWDSMQLPVGQLYGSQYHLGNYDQCLREKVVDSHLPFLTQYCLAEVIFHQDKEEVVKDVIDLYGSTDRYIYSVSKHRFNVFHWGVCTPQICEIKSVKKFIKALLKQSHLRYLRSSVEITIDKCEAAGETKRHTDGFYIVLIAILSTSIPVFMCTFYISQQRTVNSNSYVTRVIQCFCIKRNMKEFLERNNSDINILHGMRFLSCCVIVFAHLVFISMLLSTGNALDFDEFPIESLDMLLHLVIVVDTFFLMSGLLFVRSIKRSSTHINLGKLIIKRYFRLIWWYMIGLFMMFFILPRTGCGPLCSKFMKPELDACFNSWWSCTLMLGNYFNISNMCLFFSWYIYSDFHMTIVAAALFWLYKKQRRAGIICFTLLTILSVILPGLVTYYNTSEIIGNPFNFDFYRSMRNMTEIFWRTYLMSHYRATPYLAGLALGYIMSKYDPKEFRSTITKKQYLNGLLMLVTAIGILVILFFFMSNALRNAVFASLYRLIWAIMICVLIIVCEYGSFSIATEFLSWPIFVPLSKLTYGIYMIHAITISYNMVSIRSPLYFNGYILVEKFLGNLTLDSFISLYVLLFVEAPLNNLVKVLLARRDNAIGKLKGKPTEAISTDCKKKYL